MMDPQKLTQNQIKISYLELSDELGYHEDTIGWIHYCIYELCRQDDKAGHITAENICAALIKDLKLLYSEPLIQSLKRLKLNSSKDIGIIVHGLASRGLVVIGEGESIGDYDEIFTVDNIGTYLEKEGIKERNTDFSWWYHKIMWCLYIAGGMVVVASYGNLVNSRIAWIGWGIGMCGFLMQFYRPQRKRYF